MEAEQAVLTYKRLAKVERAFRTMKSVDLQVRPIYHRTEERVKAHLFICMLAYYVEWHLREAWAPLLYTDEEGSQRDTPVAPGPGQRVRQAQEEARPRRGRASPAILRRPHEEPGHPLTWVRVGEDGPLYTRTTRPTPLQARAFALIGVAIA